VFFVVNFMMDSILLLITRKLLGSQVSCRRIYLGAAVGAALTCVIITLPIPYAAVKILLFHSVANILMIQAGLGIGWNRELVKAGICLYISSFLVGGICQFLYSYVRIGSMFFFLAIVSYYIVSGILSLLEILLKERAYRCQVLLCKDSRTVKVEALIDTGNSLRDAVTDQPVCIIDRSAAIELFEANALGKVRYIPYHSIGKKEGIMPLVTLDYMCILKNHMQRIEKPLVAICEDEMTEDKYRMILNPDILQKKS
jgi:stage II sporulation protein GA (sporulation sigma-E factor processing peptidase)